MLTNQINTFCVWRAVIQTTVGAFINNQTSAIRKSFISIAAGALVHPVFEQTHFKLSFVTAHWIVHVAFGRRRQIRFDTNSSRPIADIGTVVSESVLTSKERKTGSYVTRIDKADLPAGETLRRVNTTGIKRAVMFILDTLVDDWSTDST